MKTIIPLLALILLATTSGLAQKPIHKTAKKKTRIACADTIRVENMNWWDSGRKRLVPVACYQPLKSKGARVVLVSHGYGQNSMESYHQYAYICNCLAKNGYFVVSIQHELSSDPLLNTVGKAYDTRMSNWVRGTENINFVLGRLRKSYPQLDYKHVSLIGHSNGGDMSMLFAQKYPKSIDKVISLDNRRMPLPRAAHPRVYTIRSSDQPADSNVLPTSQEQKKYGMVVVTSHCTHNEMDDDANDQQRKEINKYLLSFLKAK